VKGYPNASFRAFATEQEARSFVTGNAGDDKRRKATVRKLYAVRRGRQPGLYNTWGEVEEQVKGYPNASFRSFATEQEAQRFMSTATDNQGDETDVVEAPAVPSSVSRRNDSGNEYHIVQFDGGARGNPGVAGAGVVLMDSEGKVMCKKSMFLGEDVTNNQAEYEALIMGLNLGLQMGLKNLRVEGDSELVINQVTGHYKVRDQHLLSLRQKASEILEQMEDVVIAHIPRNENKIADALANQAMDTKQDEDLKL